jgi:regulatory protein
MTNENLKEFHKKMAVLCSRTEQCSPDIHKKIIAAGFNSEDADSIISNLKKENFINDERYVNSYISEKFRINRWGKVKMKYYLKMKGLDEDLIKKGLDGMDQEEYRKVLINTLKEKAGKVKKKNKFEKMGQIIRFAQNRGFEPELIHRYLNEVIE